MRGPHLQSHVDHVVMCQVKTFYLHIHKAHGPQNLVVSVNLLNQNEGPHLRSHVTFQLCGHVKNQNRHISSTTGLSRCKRETCPCQKETQKCQQNVEMK